jgi:hypothetical protein
MTAKLYPPPHCKDCGMADQPIDYYRRCSYCADLAETRGLIKSVQPRWQGDHETVYPVKWA